MNEHTHIKQPENINILMAKQVPVSTAIKLLEARGWETRTNVIRIWYTSSIRAVLQARNGNAIDQSWETYIVDFDGNVEIWL